MMSAILIEEVAICSFIISDRIELLRYDGDDELFTVDYDTGKVYEGVYRYEYGDKKDKYSVFLGGNHGHIGVDREGKKRETMVVIKDSFANSALPFLAHHYRILAIDPRYCQKIDLAALAATCDRALILCGMETLTQVPFLSALLKHG